MQIDKENWGEIKGKTEQNPEGVTKKNYKSLPSYKP